MYDHLLKLSKAAAENIQYGTDKTARLLVRINSDDKLELCADGEAADGVVEHAVVVTGDPFDDDVAMLVYDGFPLIRIAENVVAGQELAAAADGSGRARVAIATKPVVAIAKTGANVASDFPFVRAQWLRKAQYVKA